MSSSFFDRQNGDTVNTLTPENITEYMQILGYDEAEYEMIGGELVKVQRAFFTERDCKFVQGEVLIEPRGNGSLQK
jgi:hypothetical protein